MRYTFALAALLLAAPASAQTPESMSAEAEHSLKCAMWAAMLAGSDRLDAEAKQSLGFGLSYWVGQFEGLTGRHFDDVATVEFVEGITGEIEALAATCGPEMEQMGKRMADWGGKMQAAGQ